MKIFFYIDKGLEKICSLFLIINVFTILFLGLTSIILRWFHSSFLWIGPLTRHLIFVSIFLAASLASSREQHIGIDILPRYLEISGQKELKKWLERFIALVIATALIWLSLSSLKLIQVEILYGKNIFWGIHSSFFVSVIPLGSAIICYRFLFSAFNKS